MAEIRTADCGSGGRGEGGGVVLDEPTIIFIVCIDGTRPRRIYVIIPCTERHQRSAPHAMQTVPHTMQTVPHAMQTVPHAMQTVPHAMQTVPHAMRTVDACHSHGASCHAPCHANGICIPTEPRARPGGHWRLSKKHARSNGHTRHASHWLSGGWVGGRMQGTCLAAIRAISDPAGVRAAPHASIADHTRAHPGRFLQRTAEVCPLRRC